MPARPPSSTTPSSTLPPPHPRRSSPTNVQCFEGTSLSIRPRRVLCSSPAGGLCPGLNIVLTRSPPGVLLSLAVNHEASPFTWLRHARTVVSVAMGAMLPLMPITTTAASSTASPSTMYTSSAGADQAVGGMPHPAASSFATPTMEDDSVTAAPATYLTLGFNVDTRNYEAAAMPSLVIGMIMAVTAISTASELGNTGALAVWLASIGISSILADFTKAASAFHTSRHLSSKPYAQILSPFMVPISTVFFAHEVFENMAEKENCEHMLCTRSQGQSLEGCWIDMVAGTWKFSGWFDCCALEVFNLMGNRFYQKSWSLPMYFDLANIKFEVLMTAWPPPNQRIGRKFMKPGVVECNKGLVHLTLQP